MKHPVLTALGAGAAALVLAVGANTYFGHDKPPAVEPAPRLDIDLGAAAGKLTGALRAVTISDPGDKDANVAEFNKLQAHIDASFPRVGSELKKERVGTGHALLYTWQGTDPALPAVMWMAHQDVVPVAPGTEKNWRHPPFAGVVAEGFIWGRGAWDDKGNMFAQLEAIEALIASGFRPMRTIYLAYGADEEVGGKRGAAAIATLLGKRGVKLDYVIDEGLLILQGIVPGLPKAAATVGVAEKGYATFRLEVSAPPGHSSMPPGRTVIGMLGKALGQLEEHQMPLHSDGLAQQMFETLAPEMGGFDRVALSNFWLFRPILERKLEKSPSINAMLRTTSAPTLISAGVKENVLPGYASAMVNFRLLPGDTIADAQRHIESTIQNDAIRVSLNSDFSSEASSVVPADSIRLATLNRTIREVFPAVVVAPGLMIGGTDSRYMHALTSEVFKFTPMHANHEDLARFHGTNERISLEAYGDMIRFYYRLAQNTAR